MKKVCIIIPVYKPIPNKDEQISFLQCLRVLKNYSIVIVHPKSLNINFYYDLARNCSFQLEHLFFDDGFFKDISGYNRLMLSRQFYNYFLDYKFILIYQLDAYVFKDELDYWCSQNFDFLGSPLFEGWQDSKNQFKFIQGANGGFSLRNVNSSLRILRRMDRIEVLKRCFYHSGLNRLFHFARILQMLKLIFKIKNVSLVALTENYRSNEDYLWSYIFAKGFNDFKVPDDDILLRFSFEVHPSYLYKLNNNQLPFGCHAWSIYEQDFWKDHIKS